MDDDEITKQQPDTEPARPKRIPPNAGIGRPKGTPNKTTQALKDAIMNAFEQVGGEDYLVKVANDDPKTFMALLGKVLPFQIKAEVDHNVSGITFTTMYEKAPEALPAPVIDLTAEFIETQVAEAIEVTPPASPSQPLE